MNLSDPVIEVDTLLRLPSRVTWSLSILKREKPVWPIVLTGRDPGKDRKDLLN